MRNTNVIIAISSYTFYLLNYNYTLKFETVSLLYLSKLGPSLLENEELDITVGSKNITPKI